MYKLRTIKIQLLLLMMSISLHGMLWENKVAWDVIMEHNVSPKDYGAHCTLNLVNKECYQVVENRYRSQKKLIEKLMWRGCTLNVPKHIAWNKDFTRCAWGVVEQKSSIQDSKKLELTLVKLDDDRKDIIVQTDICDGYRCPAMEDRLCPMFNKEGGVFYYGIGNKMGQERDPGDCLVEYSLAFDNKMQIKRIVVGYNESNICYAHELPHYPVLLKAVLQSAQTYDCPGICEGIEKVCHINGMIIPANYMVFKKHLFGSPVSPLLLSMFGSSLASSHAESLYTLDDNMVKQIEKRRKTQQQEKNNTNSCEKYI